jgi:hypothetical protein
MSDKGDEPEKVSTAQEEEEPYGEEGADDEDDEELFKNNHDLIGVEGIIRA